jgi:hypothetical protein
VLHLAGGEALGVDVGDFLELQRALERDWIAGATADCGWRSSRRSQPMS